MTELILIRHGETDWNRELRFQGHADVPLNDVGQEQARRVAARLASESVRLLVSSDLQRAVQDGHALFLEIGADAGLAGVAERSHPSLISCGCYGTSGSSSESGWDAGRSTGSTTRTSATYSRKLSPTFNTSASVLP